MNKQIHKNNVFPNKFLSRLFSPDYRRFSPESCRFSPEFKSLKSAKIYRWTIWRLWKFMKAHFSGPSHLSWNHVLTSCGALCSRSARITRSARGCGRGWPSRGCGRGWPSRGCGRGWPSPGCGRGWPSRGCGRGRRCWGWWAAAEIFETTCARPDVDLGKPRISNPKHKLEQTATS